MSIKKIYYMIREIYRRLHGYLVNWIMFQRKKIKPGINTIIYGKIKIYGGRNSIQIGRNVILRSGLNTNPLGGAKYIVFNVPTGGYLKIGNNVGISNSCLVASKGIIIEDNVLIGGDCKLYDADFHSIEYEERITSLDVTKKSSEIIIREGAWLGAHCIILKGVTIGKRSVIAAGSIVTKNIPDDELWGGNPAKFIRKLNEI